MTYADALGPTVIEVPTAGDRRRRPVARRSRRRGRRPHRPEHAGQRALAAVRRTATPDRARHRARGVEPSTPTTGSTGRPTAGDIVRVHWYEGGDAFGQRALRSPRTPSSAASCWASTETEPVDFFIYADQEAFYDALGPGHARERRRPGQRRDPDAVRAHHARPRSTTPGSSVVIPHELTHLVFDTAVDNPYHFPPRWLNEGLAVYQSEGYDARDRATIERRARSAMLIPLDGLAGQFPTTTSSGFRLAYAESVSAVDYFVRTTVRTRSCR